MSTVQEAERVEVIDGGQSFARVFRALGGVMSQGNREKAAGQLKVASTHGRVLTVAVHASPQLALAESTASVKSELKTLLHYLLRLQQQAKTLADRKPLQSAGGGFFQEASQVRNKAHEAFSRAVVSLQEQLQTRQQQYAPDDKKSDALGNAANST